MISISNSPSTQAVILLVKGQHISESKLLEPTIQQALEKKNIDELKIYTTINEAQQDCIVIPYSPSKDGSEYAELEKLRTLGNTAFSKTKELQAKSVSVQSELDEDLSFAFLEGFALSNYSFDKYKSKKSELFADIVIADGILSSERLDTLNHITESVFYARDIVNEPHSGLNAQEISASAENFAQKLGITYKELGKEEITQLGMGGVLGVNQGSKSDPTFTVLEWKPADAINSKPIVLVGKGVVYDSGGYSIKTGDGMKDMKCDMGGAAVVFGGIYLAALEKLPLHIVSLVPAVENMINEHAIVPGDVLTMSDGTTVEVLNTDAEGRLILADALVYAKKYEPEFVFNFATLTGAAMRALGHGATAYMGTANESIKKLVEESAFATHERVAELPLWEDYAEQLKSNVADISNLGGPLGGAITAGKFLQHFVKYPWLHFDIAGPAFLGQASSYRPAGGTGTGVRFLLDFFRKYIEHVKN